MKLILTIALSVLVLAACKNPPGPEANPAQPRPRIVSAHVGALLVEAQTMTKAGDWKGAAAKVNEADGQANKTADDTQVINQMRHYIEVSSSRPSQP